MTNMVQVFTNKEFGSVRTFEVNNEIVFVGKDVATILGYRNPNEAIIDHVEDEDKFLRSEKGRDLLKLFSSLKEMNQILGRQDNWFINESGLYSLIFSSKLPSAKRFKRWITSEVLPCIRKNGMYMNQEVAQEAIEDPSVFLAKALHVANDVIKNHLHTIKQQEQKIQTLQPKADHYDEYMRREDSFTVSDVARSMGYTPHYLFELLTRDKWLEKIGKYVIGEEAPEGIFKKVQTYWQGTERGTQIRVTVKGFHAITKRYNQR